MSVRFDFAGRQRIEKSGVVGHGLLAADGVQRQRVYFVAQRFFTVLAANLEQRVIGDNFRDARVRRTFIFRDAATRTPCGNLNVQAFEDDARNVSGPKQEKNIMSLYGELLHGHQGRRSRRTRRVNEGEALSNASRMRKIRYVKFSEGDLAEESFLERLLHALAGEREMPAKNKQPN